MTFDDAVAALEGAVEGDAAAEASEPSLFRQPEAPTQQAAEPSAPQGNAPASAAPVTPEAPVAPVAPEAPVDTFDGGLFNPDTLPAELKPAWTQLQSAFTRKTQEVAEQRRQLESLGDLNEIQQAAQLYQQLQDPNNWPRLQSELADLMQQRGIAPAVPVAPVAPAVPAAPGLNLDELVDYPELAPVVQTMKAMQDQMQALSRSVEEREQAFRLEQQQMAVAGEFARQEAVLLAQGRSASDMQRITDLSQAHQGNLLAAAQAYDQMRQDVLSEYVATKQSAERSPVAPIAGAAVSSTAPSRPQTLEQATDLAIETLKAAGLDTLDI